VALVDPCSLLLPFDLTRGGNLFGFRGHADVKEVGLYVQDTITAGNWSFNVGLRGDIYRGIESNDNQVEPRLGVAYNIKPTNTVLRVSYARVMETPFNENLVVGSLGDPTGVFSSVLGQPGPIRPGQRNEFHAGLQQAFGRFLVIDGDYLWKYTHNAYDFGVLFNTPITFPIAWDRSKISGFSIRASVPNYHGLTAFVVMSGVNSRFFNPQVGGLGMAPGSNIGDGFGVFEATHGTAPKYADKDVINPGSVMLSGAMMFEFLGWNEAAKLIEDGIARTIQQKKVTYDLERMMPGATKVGTSAFATAIIENMRLVSAAGK